MTDDRVKVYDVHPEALGWKLSGKDKDGRNVWVTDKGERHLFAKGQKEELAIPSYPWSARR